MRRPLTTLCTEGHPVVMHAYGAVSGQSVAVMPAVATKIPFYSSFFIRIRLRSRPINKVNNIIQVAKFNFVCFIGPIRST